MSDETTQKSDETTGGSTAVPQSKTSRFSRPGRSKSTEEDTGHRQLPTVSMDVKAIRILLARIVWAVTVFFALVLAGAALLFVLEANPQNALVEFVGDFSKTVDLGVFDISQPIAEFGDGTQPTKSTVLFNYGLGAVAWLIIGRIADRLIRP